METKPGFELEQKLGAWRQTLAASPALSPESAEELELHLRDSMARLREKGLTEEEAFLVAARRLGSVAALSEEFGKLNGGQVSAWRAFWMIVGVLAWLAVSGVSGVLGNAAVWVAQQLPLGVSGYGLGWVGALANLLVLVVCVAVLWRFALARGSAGLPWLQHFLARPWRAGSVLVVALIGLTAARMAMPVLLVRSTPSQELGWIFAVQQGVAVLAALSFPAVLVVLLGVLFRRRPHNASTALLGLAVVGLGLLASGCGKQGSSPADSTPPNAQASASTPMEEVLALWKQGEKEQAVEKLLRVDCGHQNLFSKGNVLGYSEAQFVALPAAARDKLAPELTDGLAVVKALGRELVATGSRAASSGDKAKAEACTTQLRRLGEALSRAQYTTMAQLVGKALVKMAAAPPAR